MSIDAIFVALLPGLWVTLQILLGAGVLGVLASFVSGLCRMSRYWWVSWPAAVYVETFRGTSALVQLFWVYFVLPLFGVELGAMVSVIVVLGLNTGAYGAEIVRGAVQAVPRGQVEAGIALNMSRFQRMWLVILPQAGVSIIPPMGNLMIELLKNTALASLITLSDLTFKAQMLRSETLQTAEIFGLVLVLYFLTAQCMAVLFKGLERRMGRGVLSAGGR